MTDIAVDLLDPPAAPADLGLAGEVLGDSGAAVSLSADGTDTWHLVSTPDYYYQLQLAGSDHLLEALGRHEVVVHAVDLAGSRRARGRPASRLPRRCRGGRRSRAFRGSA